MQYLLNITVQTRTSAGVDNLVLSTGNQEQNWTLQVKCHFPYTVQLFTGKLDKKITVTGQHLHLAKRVSGKKYEHETIPHLAFRITPMVRTSIALSILLMLSS